MTCHMPEYGIHNIILNIKLEIEFAGWFWMNFHLKCWFEWTFLWHQKLNNYKYCGIIMVNFILIIQFNVDVVMHYFFWIAPTNRKYFLITIRNDKDFETLLKWSVIIKSTHFIKHLKYFATSKYRQNICTGRTHFIASISSG